MAETALLQALRGVIDADLAIVLVYELAATAVDKGIGLETDIFKLAPLPLDGNVIQHRAIVVGLVVDDRVLLRGYRPAPVANTIDQPQSRMETERGAKPVPIAKRSSPPPISWCSGSAHQAMSA